MKAVVLDVDEQDGMIIEFTHVVDYSLEQSLEFLQGAVGGYIEGIYFRDGGVGYLNEEGKLNGLQINRAATILAQQQQAIMPEDFIAGPLVLCGTKGEYNDEPLEWMLALVSADDHQVGVAREAERIGRDV